MSNNNLFRFLKNGSAYNALIPKSTCEKVSFGKGDTHFSIEMIVKQALQHNKQVEKLASKLKAESGAGSLQEICYRIHQFLYWHLQYKADGEAQLLRSPACAWQQRKDGIDCKSYSIFASAILLQLGIKHYIRKIKQPTHNPEHYSHVYVIVPKNQDTGNLDKGYYTIDGTLQHITEPIYINKKDFFMDTLPHFGLNGTGGFNFDVIKNYLSTPISCWGGSSFSGEKANTEGVKIGAYFERLLNNINLAVKNQNLEALKNNYTQFEGILFTAIKAYRAKKTEGWNKCTTESITRMETILNFYEKVVFVGLNGWLDMYFNSNVINTKRYTNNADFENIDPNFYFTYTGPQITHDAQVKSFTLKQGVSNIPAFEFTPYVESVASNPNNFNLATFLNGLSTVLVSFQGGGAGNTSGGQLVYDNNNPNFPNVQPTTSQSGFGLLGWIVVLGGLGYAFTQMKDKGVAKPTSTTRTTPTTRKTTKQIATKK